VRQGVFPTVLGLWLVLAAWSAGTQASSPQSGALRFGAVVAQYCVTCHNDRARQGGLVLEHLDLAGVGAHPEIWEKVVRKLERGMMPPQGVRRPDEATYTALTAWIAGELDRAAVAHPDPPLLHRMNRAEYANAVRDLLAIDLGDVASILPADDSAYGFDNIAEALGVSSVLLERYVAAAGRLSALAVGDLDVAPGSETYVLRQDFSQDQHVDGLPLGTVGGMAVLHTFPVDGEYELRAALMRTNVDQTRGLEYARQIEMTVDGERVFLGTVGGAAPTTAGGTEESAKSKTGLSRSDSIDAGLRIRVPVKAGPHSITVAVLQKTLAQNSRKLVPYRASFDSYDATGVPHIRSLAVVGPYNVAGSGDTPSRRRVFICHPTTHVTEESCATRILSTLARRAYRQPATGVDLQRLLEFYRTGRRDGTFETGIERGLQRILASPKFLIRVERDPETLPPGSVHRVTDHDLASRLSFFLWSTIPDDGLLALADQGRLKDPTVLERQVRRMLADPKADALVTNFAGQWLQLRNLRNAVPDEDTFPEFDDNLRQSFRRETELLFQSIVREDRNVVDLLTADYTFVNERLARHYGLPYVYGSQFRRVAVTDEARRGLLGQGSILTLTSNADRTSPVLRGKWILSNLLGAPPNPPPVNVPPLVENQDRPAPLSMRAQMQEHRASPVCAGCHKVMDPPGFALENFDAVGAWRTGDAAGPIDASAELADGTKVDGVVGLRQALLKRPEIFVSTMTEKLLTYAVGRGLNVDDMPAVRKIVRESAGQDYRFSSIVLGIVKSVPFQMRTKPVREG
jgi:mono/diheme cytochrome c family protein